jgi:hypothetical protein
VAVVPKREGRTMGWQDDEREQYIDDDDELWDQLIGDDDDVEVSLLCDRCKSLTLAEVYVCDKCESMICQGCSVLAVDDQGDLVMLCCACVGDRHYHDDD